MMLDPAGLPGQVPSKRAENSNVVDWKWLHEIPDLEGQSPEGAAAIAAIIGAINPTTGLSATTTRLGANIFKISFTLDAVRLTVTDAAGSGSSASRKIWDFVTGKQVIPLGAFQNYTAFAEGSALTGAVGDAAFVLGVGSVAADAGNGALTGTEVDFAAVTGTLTNSGGTTTGKKSSGPTGLGVDGSAAGADAYLNWSGTAATIDANSTIDVTGTIDLIVMVF